jgi:hypothetical protein
MLKASWVSRHKPIASFDYLPYSTFLVECPLACHEEELDQTGHVLPEQDWNRRECPSTIAPLEALPGGIAVWAK